MTARQSQSTWLADQINKSFDNPAWNVPWARWRPSSTHGSLATKTGNVNALAVAERQGRTVIVSGGCDESIRIWDLKHGQQLGKPITAHFAWVTALAITERQGRSVIVSGSRDKSIRIWDLEHGQQLGQPLTGHIAGVTALASAVPQARSVIGFGSGDNRNRVWGL